MMGFGLPIPIVLILILAYALGWLPQRGSGRDTLSSGPGDALEILRQRWTPVPNRSRPTASLRSRPRLSR